MIPRILEYEQGRIKITAEAYCIPEIKALIDKYDMDAEPYLAYVNAVASPTSPYLNVPEDEREESIIYDVQQTLSEFDYNDPLVKNAIDKLKSLYSTTITLMADELGEEMHRMRKKLRDTAIIMGGQDDNFKSRMALMERIDKIATSYSKIRKQADEEIKAATKGDHEVGDY